MADALGQSPAYLAYLRSLGVTDANDAAGTQTGVDTVQRRTATMLPRIAEQGAISREGISGNYESRGLYRSGQHEVSLARQRAGEGQQVGDLQSGGADQIALLQATLVQQRAARQRQLVEQALNAANGLYAQSGTDALLGGY